MSVSLNKNEIKVLGAIASGQVNYIPKNDVGVSLVQKGLIQVDTTNVDQNGNAAVRLTELGTSMANTANTKPAVVSNGAAKTTSPYAILSGVVLPASKRGFAKGGGAPAQYPFDTLEVGQSFFVPTSEKHKDPVKTLGSTVSAQNHKYSEETGETEVKQRAKRGPKNKAVLDDNGQKIMETVTVKLRKPVRKFTIRPIKAGVEYGTWKADADGAMIARIL